MAKKRARQTKGLHDVAEAAVAAPHPEPSPPPVDSEHHVLSMDEAHERQARIQRLYEHGRDHFADQVQYDLMVDALHTLQHGGPKGVMDVALKFAKRKNTRG